MRKTITDFFSKNSFQILLQVIALAVVVFNMWLAYRLAPLAVGIDRLETRVLAIEENKERNAGLIERFIVVEEKVDGMRGDIQELKDSQNRMEGKIDRLLEK